MTFESFMWGIGLAIVICAVVFFAAWGVLELVAYIDRTTR